MMGHLHFHRGYPLWLRKSKPYEIIELSVKEIPYARTLDHPDRWQVLPLERPVDACIRMTDIQAMKRQEITYPSWALVELVLGLI